MEGIDLKMPLPSPLRRGAGPKDSFGGGEVKSTFFP